MAVTFKRNVPTGKFRSFAQKFTDIKVGGKVVGQISESRTDSDWSVAIMVKREPTRENPAPFKWVTFKTRFATEAQAREFVARDWDKLAAKFDVYHQEV